MAWIESATLSTTISLNMVEQGVQTDLEFECEYLKRGRHLNKVLKRALALVPQISNDVEAATEAARERAKKLQFEHTVLPSWLVLSSSSRQSDSC